MEESVWMGRGRELIAQPAAEWREQLAHAPAHIAPRLAFMEPDHHRVRNHVVVELPRRGGAVLPAAAIAEALGLTPARCEAILAELERGLFFLVRDGAGDVQWAFPVTAAPTPHRITFSSGERLYGA